MQSSPVSVPNVILLLAPAVYVAKCKINLIAYEKGNVADLIKWRARHNDTPARMHRNELSDDERRDTDGNKHPNQSGASLLIPANKRVNK